MSKLKILLIIFPIVLISVLGFLFSFFVQEARAATVSVVSSNDDAYQDGYMGTMYLNTPEIRMIYYLTPDPDIDYEAGFRWVISIPKGSTINTAYARFYVYDVAYDNITSSRLKFQKTGNPPSFTSANNNITTSGRTKTTSYTTWSANPGTTGWLSTPSLVASLQEVVNSYDVTALVLLTTWSANSNSLELRVRSWDYSPTYAPQLVVDYTPPPVSPTVTTDTATVSLSATTNQATLKGTITATGGASVDLIRFVWGTSVGSYASSSGDISYTGTFQYVLTGMTPGTTYYYKAQAHNSAGWSDLASTNERRVVIYQASGGKKPFTATTATTTLTLNKNIAAAGTVISSTGGINCGLACLTQTSTPIASGTSVVLTPTAAPGYTFSSWAGCNSVTGNNCNVTMNVNKTVTATFSLNSRPYVSSAALSGSALCNVFPGGGQVGFGWVYNDDEGDSQSDYRLQISTNTTFSPLFVNYTISKVVASGQPESSAILVVPDPSSYSRCISGGDFEGRCVPYNNTYFWRVSVKAGTGNLNWSDPKPDPPTSFDAPSHAYPWTMFAPSPSKPAANQEVKFIQDGSDFITDLSLCYSGGEGLCQNKISTTYSWNFGNGNTSPYKGNATTTYSAAGNYNVTLTITDDVGSCTKTKAVTIGPSLPNWYEVPPF